MTTRRTLILFALLTGCGGAACPEPRAANDASEVAAPADEGMDGTWVLAEIDDADVEGMLEIRGDAGRAIEDDPERPLPLRVIREGEITWIEIATDGEEPHRMRWVRRGPGLAYLVDPTDDDLLVARRAGLVPEVLRGEWHVHSPEAAEHPALSFTADEVEMTIDGRTVRGAAWGLTPEGDTVELALTEAMREEPGIVILVLHPMGDGSFLGWPHGDDDYLVVTRPGPRPAWMGEPPELPPGEGEAPEDEASELEEAPAAP